MSKQDYILSIDQGTTSSRALLFDRQGTLQAQESRELTQSYPQPGWVEHDPKEIWDTSLYCCTEVLSRAGISGDDVAAIGITNQRETILVWDAETGEPVYPAIVWQSRQSAAVCQRLQAAGHSDLVRRKTGLLIDSYFSASKLTWLFEQHPDIHEQAQGGRLRCGTVDTWLLWNLSNGSCHATDVTNASRTLLYNIHTMDWDEELCALFSVPVSCLPEVKASSGIFCTSDSSHFGVEIPIAGIAGDQQAALFGQTCFQERDTKNTYGTGCFMLTNTGSTPVPSEHGLLTTVAWDLGAGPSYALEGSVFVAGAAVQWLRDGLQLIDTAADAESRATSVDSHLGVYMVPAFVGLGTPYWDSDARGALFGLTRGTTADHIIRATLESLAFQSYDLLHAMELDCGYRIEGLKVDGGASRNDFLMQFQADVLQGTVTRSALLETTALGAAYLAGLAVGFFESLEVIASLWKSDRQFQPAASHEERDRRLEGWHNAVSATRSFQGDGSTG